MNTVAENVASTVDQAEHKAEELRGRGRFLVSAMLAGAYIAVGEVLLLGAISPFVASHSPAAKLLEGAVFPIALTLVMFAGAQLFTSTVMIMLIGTLSGRTGVKDMLVAWVATLVGNFLGTLAFAAMVHGSGIMSSASARTMLTELLSGKDALGGGQLFWRAVLCNMLVCLAVWMFSRVRGSGAKIALLWMPVLVFVAVGFEHCVANMSLYTIGIFEGQATFAELGRNLLYTVPGNIVGGGLLVGAVYWYTSGARRTRTADQSERSRAHLGVQTSAPVAAARLVSR
ncbi:formate/nitrite transporter family protein [Nocardia terrae]|uniref:formate/nitrite transporter family protein n=1 Tax=Nocardia terrae TaxID=2675851 RepID=UPI0012FC4B5C|nr:formate/nitrite transporter family protein [Nocardia terrae]